MPRTSGIIAKVLARIGSRQSGSAAYRAVEYTPQRLAAWQHSAVDDDGYVVWPDDPDEVPAWRLEREAWASRAGITLPPYRTRREFQQHEDMAAIDAAPPAVVSNPVALSIDDAATQFLEFMIVDDRTGEFSASEISAHYAEFCEHRRIAPCPVDQVKAALALMQPRVRRIKTDQRINGKRHRSIRWVIEPADAGDCGGGQVVVSNVTPIRMAA